MSTRVRVTMLVDVPFSALAEHLAGVLRGRRDLFVSPLRAPGEHVRITWGIVEDTTDEVRKHDAIALDWVPDHPHLFPSFHGLISVRPYFRRSWMRIAGAYDPPLAATGRVIDRIVGRFAAWMTLRRIANELRREIELRYRVNLQEVGAAGTDRHAGGESDVVTGPH